MASLWEQMGRSKKKDGPTSLPAQYPKSAPLSMQKKFYEKYVQSGFATDFLKEKGMKPVPEYGAGSFSEYLDMRGIDYKAYGGRVQPRKAAGSSETQ